MNNLSLNKEQKKFVCIYKKYINKEKKNRSYKSIINAAIVRYEGAFLIFSLYIFKKRSPT